MRSKVLLLFVGLILACGGVEGQLSSVIVNASLEQSSIDADTAFWVDSNDDGVCDYYTIKPTTVNVTISTNPLPNIPGDVPPSPVVVERVDIIYSRADNTSPNLPEDYRSVGVKVDPDRSTVVEIEVLSQSQKRSLIESYYILRTNPNLPIYRYYVTLRIWIREVYSGITSTIERGFYMEVSDFVSENECQ